MYISEVRVENFRCLGSEGTPFKLPLNPGLTALVGENDSGKTAAIDAIRYALGTRDQEWLRMTESDFYSPDGGNTRATQIRIRLRFDGLSNAERASFVEHLSYETSETEETTTVLYLNWIASMRSTHSNARTFFPTETRSGEDGKGPILDGLARELLKATYLRPLRDAEKAMASGRSSRLSQVLLQTPEITEWGKSFEEVDAETVNPETLSVLGVGDYATHLLENRKGIEKTKERLNTQYLKPLSFKNDILRSRISVSTPGSADFRLRRLLEKLELSLTEQTDSSSGNRRGLGSHNLLFMACELLLLGSDAEGLPLLLIEEPEAHIHPQRQLRLMQFLQDHLRKSQQSDHPIQALVSTHSPQLASQINLENLVIVQGGKAFSMGPDSTMLEKSDYRFLQRFLDITKANLFFARGLMIVEGDAENILLPTLAKLLGRDFGAYGVSIVNVGGVGLRRYAQIFIRRNIQTESCIKVPVACLTDLDVMPNCAPEITGKVKPHEDWPKGRRWKVKKDFTQVELDQRRASIEKKAQGQNVRTFVSDSWTLEYDLAFYGLAKEVWLASCLAQEDEKINLGEKNRDDVIISAKERFQRLSQDYADPEILASHVYAQFTTGTKASKAITAQYLAELLEEKFGDNESITNSLEQNLPKYIVDAIKYVTSPVKVRGESEGKVSEETT